MRAVKDHKEHFIILVEITLKGHEGRKCYFGLFIGVDKEFVDIIEQQIDDNPGGYIEKHMMGLSWDYFLNALE
jgi:hypothetical protein